MLRPIPKVLWPRAYPLFALLGLGFGLVVGGLAFWVLGGFSFETKLDSRRSFERGGRGDTNGV